MNAEYLAAIRERAARPSTAADSDGIRAVIDRDELLDHIDALTAKVEDLDAYDNAHTEDGWPLVPSNAVLAILRGEA